MLDIDQNIYIQIINKLCYVILVDSYENFTTTY